MTASSDQYVSVDQHRIKLTNLDKVLYPATGTTKGDVIAYYAEIATVLLPHSRDRPATRKRWVHGVGTAQHPGEMFFQKNLDDSTPSWVARRDIHHKTSVNAYPLVNDVATLTWLGQIAALEIHVPQWRFGRTGVEKNPDRLVLDLDPGPGAGLAECVQVANRARAILRDMGLTAMPVTSGSKGIHLYAALDGKQTSDQVTAVAHELARALEADDPDLVVSDMKKSLREGKVLVDWSQNNGNKTTITPYSLRGRERPTVAAPRTWRELASKDLAQLEFDEVLRRVKRRGDPLADLTAGALQALDPTPEAMATFSTTPQSRDRLDKYRSMRDGNKTPEPVPAASAADSSPGNGMSFVIQEHHARRLHWDFRLEHDGVLVSWALPKGVPTDTKQNHLAVQTEDHPLEYGTFEGSIPAGEYGAGEVTIWDAGTYELEKWRDGKEVIITLNGEQHGTAKYALIHTGGAARAENNWLIHLMKADAAAASPPAASDSPPEPAPAVSKRTRISTSSRAVTLPYKPMLATLGAATDLELADGSGDEWAYEMKWDGIRAIAQIIGDTVRFVSRNGLDLTPAYPELAELPRHVDADCVLDGEIVALDRSGRPDFGLLQTRMKLTKAAEIDAVRAKTPVRFVIFDILEMNLDGTSRSLVKRSYAERRELLESSVETGGSIDVPGAFEGDLDAAVASSIQLGLEGVMAKKVDSTYTQGKRSRAWVKIKNHRTQEVVIGGWRPGRGRRKDTIGSLLVGVPDGDDLRYVGRVGTGFDDAELASLRSKFSALERKTTPFTEVPGTDASDAVWVRPSLVGEVEFAEWTPTRRLRQASWRGWRPDKSPGEVVLEEP